jgi:sigma-B regulation protein RsbU (phosphoserine phosphatase)
VFISPDRGAQEEVAALRREQKQLHGALFEAAQVQRKLCAPRELHRGALEIAGEMFPVRHLSGDFFKVLDQGASVTLALGDIAGKGLSAGLWVTHLVGLVRIYAREADLAAAMSAINREVCHLLAEPPMVALFLARLDPRTGELAYCNAGQPAALLLRRGGSPESLNDGGPMLGAVPEARFACGRARLGPGDTLLAHSDGVVECRNAREEEFGARRVAAAAAAVSTLSASQVLFSTLAATLDFADGRPLEDDLTMVVAHRRSGNA